MFRSFKIGPITIPMYGLMVVVGLIAFTIVTILTLEKREKTDKRTTNNLLLVCAGGALALYAFAYLFNALFHSIAKGAITFGGITWLGGVLGAFPTMVVLIHFFCPRLKGNALFYFNLLVPAIVLGHAFGRIGCFLGGCCYGMKTDTIFGVVFPPHSPAAHAHFEVCTGQSSLPVFPTQLYEAIFEFLLFAFMMIFYKKCRKNFLVIYAFAYGTFRFLLEFLRDDNRGGTGFFLSPSQLMSIILIAAGVLILLYQQGVVFKRLKQRMTLRQKEAESAYVRIDSKRAIRRIQRLYDNGGLSKEEYETFKKRLEENIPSKNEDAPPEPIPTENE